MISSDVMRGCNDTIILYLLLKEPSYGYEISKSIRRMSEDKYVIKETTLYSAVSRMEKNGYIDSYVSAGDSGKKRTYYRITTKGIDYYKEKCDEWQVTKDVIDRFVEENLSDSDKEMNMVSATGQSESDKLSTGREEN